MKYVVEKTKKGRRYRYWQPKESYLIAGEWRRCPFGPVRLPDDDSWVLRADEMNRRLDRWRLDGIQPLRHFERGMIGWLIGEYKKDDRFTSLEKMTQKKNLIVMRALQDKYGNLPADKMSRMAARAFCLSFEARSRQELTVSVCRVIYNFGRDAGMVKENPFEGMRLAKMKPRNAVWPGELLEAVKAKAMEQGCKSIALAVQLGLDTGQRAGDLRALTWSSYAGGRLRFRQSKTGAVVEVPVMKTLKAMLAAAEKERSAPAILICEATGNPYGKDMLSRKFREICEKVEGAAALQFRDLRRTAVVRLAEHGCTNAEIAAITGHSLQDTVNILEVYLPRSSVMAANAIAKLEPAIPALE